MRTTYAISYITKNKVAMTLVLKICLEQSAAMIRSENIFFERSFGHKSLNNRYLMAIR